MAAQAPRLTGSTAPLGLLAPDGAGLLRNAFLAIYAPAQFEAPIRNGNAEPGECSQIAMRGTAYQERVDRGSGTNYVPPRVAECGPGRLTLAQVWDLVSRLPLWSTTNPPPDASTNLHRAAVSFGQSLQRHP